MQRPSFEFQILVLRALALLIRMARRDVVAADDMLRDLDAGIQDVMHRRDRREE